MDNSSDEVTDGILNEITHTVHKQEVGGTEFQTKCGVTYHLTHTDLQCVLVEEVVGSTNASKCGRCFPGSSGY